MGGTGNELTFALLARRRPSDSLPPHITALFFLARAVSLPSTFPTRVVSFYSLPRRAAAASASIYRLRPSSPGPGLSRIVYRLDSSRMVSATSPIVRQSSPRPGSSARERYKVLARVVSPAWSRQRRSKNSRSISNTPNLPSATSRALSGASACPADGRSSSNFSNSARKPGQSSETS